MIKIMFRKLINRLNQDWYFSIILMILGLVVSFFLIQIDNVLAFNLGLIIFLLSVLISLIFGVIRLFKRDYVKGTLQVLVTLIFGGIAFSFLSIFLMFYPYDSFADSLKIPENIQFEKPINQNDEYKIIKIEKPDFIIYDGPQPGNYQYEIFLNQIEKGVVYLKIYEITTNQILSEKDISEESRIQVYNPTNELKKFKQKDDFTVYEGDWGEFYGCQIEVWFQPENIDSKQRKLFSKNYIIQGWQR